MSKKDFLLVTVSILILAFAVSVGAQPGPIGQNILVKPKPGQEAQWEAAYKEHLKWHSDMNDTWGWTTYQMTSGPRAGQYFVRTGGHEWKDFDDRGDMEAKDQANFYETAGKHTESFVIWFDRIHRNLSRLPEGGGPYKVLEFTRVEVKPSMVPQFMKVVGKYHAALEKTDSPLAYAFAQTESGGAPSNFLFVGLHSGFAALEQPPDALPKMMEEVYGGMEAAGIFAEFWDCVNSLETYIAVRRDDLTYTAPESTSNE